MTGRLTLPDAGHRSGEAYGITATRPSGEVGP